MNLRSWGKLGGPAIPVLKIDAHSAHVRGTKASLGGPKSWWTRKLISFESSGNQSIEMIKAM